MTKALTLTVLPHDYAVVRLDASASVPTWAMRNQIFSVTRTTDELSILCREQDVPAGLQPQLGFRAIRATGPFDFSEVGILASIIQPLARCGISIFSVSTYDTDYIFVADADVSPAIAALSAAGHSVHALETD